MMCIIFSSSAGTKVSRDADLESASIPSSLADSVDRAVVLSSASLVLIVDNRYVAAFGISCCSHVS
eukprot:2351569-Pyramimonas_sp.AAC.1